MEEYISVAEFAKRAGISPQAVYKKLSTELSTHVKLVDGKKMLNIRALYAFRNNRVDNQVDNQIETIELLKTTVEMLQRELELKNSQIEALNSRLQESHVLIAQAQVPAIETKKGFFSRFRRKSSSTQDS